MFKKIIYSAMALSVTLLPVSEVMAATISADTTISSGTEYNLDGTTDTWTGGTITNQGGTLTIQGINQATVATPNYLQTSGNLLLTGSSTAAGTFTLQGASSSSMATISGGSVVIGNGTTGLAKGSTLTLGSYASIGSGANVSIAQGDNLVIGSSTATTPTVTLDSSDRWNGNITLSGGTLNLNGVTKATSGAADTLTSYNQTGGTLNLTNGSNLRLEGLSTSTYTNTMEISGGTVNVGSTSSTGNQLTVGPEGQIAANATVNLYTGNTINLTGNVGTTAGASPSLTLNSGDYWQGTIHTSGDGYLLLDGYNNSVTDTSSIYQQDAGSGGITLGGTNTSQYWINNSASYINGGSAIINNGSTMAITTHTAATDSSGNPLEATFGENTYLNLNQGGTLAVIGTGTAVINDNIDSYDDDWNGEVILGVGGDTPTLTLKNVTKDFTSETETAVLLQNSGTLNIYGNERGGSNITTSNLYSYTDDTGATVYAPNLNGNVNIRGYDSTKPSTLTINYASNDTDSTAPNQQISLQGNANLNINTDAYDVVRTTKIPTGTGANNTVTKTGSGSYLVGDGTNAVNMGYNMNVNEGLMSVSSPTVKIGINDEGGVTPYGSLNIGTPTSAAVYATNATNTTIVDGLTMNYGGLLFSNPGTANVGGNFTVGSGTGSYNQINMMNGGINTMAVNGTTTINDKLDLKIDVNPQAYRTNTLSNDVIVSSNVLATPNAVLELSDYNLLSQPTRDRHIFNVVNATGDYTVGQGAQKIVTGNATRLVNTYVGSYTMVPSAVKGAFEMVLINHNPEIFRGQVAADVIYANQQVINNQLFDRMIYSILPYFNGRCTNKTASADTLYSPYQYSMTDPGIWFKPYANFETIHMTHGLGKVRNNAYGGMIGADFAKKEWGSWTFIPTAYIGYNGGRTTYNGVGMWHNGGQLGLMGTLTKGDFVTMANVYGGGYHNSMSLQHGRNHDSNALWNVGVASKTVYNIHLPWDFILQPSVYMSYNYVGASKWTSSYDGFRHKVDPLNAFSVAPGLNLIWQKETFSIYALFQAMFNIGATVSGTVAEVDLPHVGIRDPYFEYGLGASKYFLDRFSGYGQVVARSGSRKGVGFQLGLNLKI